jgi:hypothetical protein
MTDDSRNDWDVSSSGDESLQSIPKPNIQVPEGKAKGKSKEDNPTIKRRCVGSACIACRKRKSKCDGNVPSCAACSSVYHTPCVYDPNSDHRRKGVYKKDIDNLRTRNITLQTLIHAILNYSDDDVYELVRQIRSCDSLEDVAESITAGEKGLALATAQDTTAGEPAAGDGDVETDIFETELAGKMSELMLDGSVKFIGGTSHLIFLPPGSELDESNSFLPGTGMDPSSNFFVASWTRVTDDMNLIGHLMTMYFTWHYAYFTTLSKDLFYRDYTAGRSSQYCSSLLVNAMLALGCHFTSWEGARQDPKDPATAGDHFFKEAKRLILEYDEHEKAKLCTVQALALMSVREAGCGREGKGWVYSGMSFRMAYDLGLNVDATSLGAYRFTEEEIDARRMTFWGCFLFDKCWSNYLGRQPQLSSPHISVPKFEIFPTEEAETWSPYTDSGVVREHTQPARTRAVALQISKLCEISNDLLVFFYHPAPLDRHRSKQTELKRLSDVHTRLEAWRKGLPKEMDAKEGQLPPVLLMHMFHQLLFIHLYRPFLKYTKSTTVLPPHVSPRKLCTQAASAISKILRIYKRSYGLRQVCNIVIYIAHSACTIHLLNLPEKNAKRDVIHGLRNLEEIAESWLCARRTLRILELTANKWHIDLPSEAAAIFERTHLRWGSWGSWDHGSPSSVSEGSPSIPKSRLSPAAPARHSTPGDSPAPTRQKDSQSPAPSHPIASQFQPSQFNNTAYMPSTDQEHRGYSQSADQTQLISDMQVPFPSNSSAQQKTDVWGIAQDIPCNTSNGSNSPAPITNASPAPIFHPSTHNVVEESQDWWLAAPSALALGLDSWGEGWGIGTTAEGDINLSYRMNIGPDMHLSGLPPEATQPYGYANKPS